MGTPAHALCDVHLHHFGDQLRSRHGVLQGPKISHRQFGSTLSKSAGGVWDAELAELVGADYDPGGEWGRRWFTGAPQGCSSL